MSTVTKSQAQNPEAVIFSTTGQIGYLFNVTQPGKIFVSLPGQNPKLIDAEAIVRSYSPVEQRDLISITRGISSNAIGVAHAATELHGKRVLLTALGKSRVGIINRVENLDDGYKIFLAVEGSVAVISASDVQELEERPQDYFISVDVIEAGKLIFWLKDFVKVDVLYTIAAKRLRVSAAVSSAIDPQICFTAQQVKITYQDLAAVDEPDSLQAYTVDCDEVSISPDQTGFNLFSASLSAVESLISLKYTALSYKSGSSAPSYIAFDKAITLALELTDANTDIVHGLLGSANYAGKTHLVSDTTLLIDKSVLLITVASEKLRYGDYDWNRESSDVKVPVLKNFGDSRRQELIIYRDSVSKLLIYAGKLGLTAGQTILVTGLPNSYTKVGVMGAEVSRQSAVFRFTIGSADERIAFLEEVSQRDNEKVHFRFVLIDDSGAVNYNGLNLLPEPVFPADHKPTLLRYKDSWAAYQLRVKPVTKLMQEFMNSQEELTNFLALTRLIKAGKADSMLDATTDLVEPAEKLLAAVRAIISDTWEN